MVYLTSEQLFQIMKFSDRETILSIYTKNGLPLKWAAKSGEKNGMCRQDWGKIIIDCMKFCLQTKYDQNEDFRKTLNETKGHYIVEDQTNIKTSKKTGKVYARFLPETLSSELNKLNEKFNGLSI